MQLLLQKWASTAALVGFLVGMPSSGSCEDQGQAREILKKMSEVYRTLESYHFEGRIVWEMKARDFEQKKEVPILKAAVLPDKLRVETGWPKRRIVSVSDGQTAWLYFAQLHQYFKSTPGDVQQLLDQGPSSGAGTLSALTRTFVNQYGSFAEKTKQAKILREESLDMGGKPADCYVLELELEAPSDPLAPGEDLPTTLWIEKSRFVVLKEVSGHRSESQEYEGILETRQTLALSLARINEPLADGLFAFTPPADASEFSLPGSSRSRRRSLKGEPAADFTLKDLKGGQVSLKSLRGKVVLLNFWASWCGPCRDEMPFIDKLQQEFKKQGLVVLGLNDEEATLAKEFLDSNRISFQSLVDTDQEVAMRYQVRAIPTIFVLNREGRIVFHGVGLSEEQPLRDALIEAGIKEQTH